MQIFSWLIAFAILSKVAATDNVAKSPVEKVVQLIEELQANLLRDAKVEQQIYDRYACWCETATGSKASAILLTQAKVQQLTQDVLELKGQVAVLAKEISDTTGLIAENEETQKSSTAVRKEENAAWMTEKAELEEAIEALERAIKVLGGAGTKTGLLQGGSTAIEAARKHAISAVLLSLPTRANLEPMQLSAIQSFASEFQPEAADASSSYAPQSATVQGILKDMYDSFSADLEKITQTEATKQKEYEDLTAGLVKELNMMNGVTANKEEEKAASEQELADTVQELDDTKKQMDADIEFFDQTKAACRAKHEEWVARKTAREEELKGIEEALKILTSDDARALFGKAIKPGMETMLLQLDSDSAQMRLANKAYDALKVGAQRTHSLRLAALAATLRGMGAGHFDAVIEEIDKMMQELKDEEAEDIKQRDWCKDEYQKNSEEKKQLKWLIKNNDAMITKLENTIDALIADITKTVEEIEVTEDQIKKMEDERKAEHEEFQTAKKDDEMAIDLLQKTVDVLSAYHKKHKTEMGPIQGSMKLLEEPEFKKSRWQAPEAKFSGTGARKNESKGIISIITMLIEDLQAEISNGVKNEVSAQADFEKEMATAKKLIEDLTEKKENLEEDKAKTEQKKADEEETKATNQESLKINEDYLQGPKGIKPDCDWMLNSFEERTVKRKAEMNGLTTAKEYLTGAAPPAMMQIGTSFDDTKLERIGFESLRR